MRAVSTVWGNCAPPPVGRGVHDGGRSSLRTIGGDDTPKAGYPEGQPGAGSTEPIGTALPESVSSAAAALTPHACSLPTVQGDVRNYDSCEAMVRGAVEEFGSLSILVNCAAGNFLAAPEQLSSNGFRTVLEIDTLGTFNVSR